MSALAPLSLEIVEYLLKVWASLFRARSLDNCCIFSLGDIFPPGHFFMLYKQYSSYCFFSPVPFLDRSS